VTARDGQEALELAVQELPDLLITDYHMPQLSGLELCQKLKQDPKTKNIPAIMLTARGYHLEPHDTEQSGVLRMLSKPFSPRALLATVNEVLALAA
jgi:CheY-like chemotaxis protein